MARTQRPVTPDDFMKLGDLLTRETDRGLAIVGWAFIEDALGELLRARMRAGSAANDLLSGALANPATRARAACAFDLIREEDYADIETIRLIRNEFGHNREATSLDEPWFKEHVMDLQVLGAGIYFSDATQAQMHEDLLKSPRERLKMCIVLLTLIILGHTRELLDQRSDE